MQVERKTEEGVILFVDVPDDAYGFVLRQNSNNSDLWYTQDLAVPGISNWIELPVFNWQLIGLTSEVTEEQAKMMVDNVNSWGKGYWKNYNIPNSYDQHLTALQSFKSLMQHKKLYEVNPYGEKPAETFNHPEWEFTRAKWQEAQERTSKRVVLFKPNEK